jgi:hypothetical protein
MPQNAVDCMDGFGLFMKLLEGTICLDSKHPLDLAISNDPVEPGRVIRYLLDAA